MESNSLRWCGTMVLAGSTMGELVFRFGEERLPTIVANVTYHEATTDKGERTAASRPRRGSTVKRIGTAGEGHRMLPRFLVKLVVLLPRR